jgi:threonine dehydratase
MIDPVRPIAIEDIEEARERIAATVLRTPLVKLDLGSDAAEVWLKLENLQPTNAYKIRGATNAVARLSDDQRAAGVWTISAGNAGQGVAYAARQLGVASTVVAIKTAPQTKLDRMRALGATIVPVTYEEAWVAAEAHEFPGLDGTFIHPFDNYDFLAGHGTMGLEIVEDLPNVRTVIAAIGGGGLITGVGSAIKARKPGVQVIGAEPESAAPYAYSLSEGAPSKLPNWQASFVDGAGGKSVTARMWQRMRPVTDGSITVTLDQTRAAMRLIAEKTRTIAEGAGALSLAAALTG